ncbi:hypothetical protein [Rheinheimera oceanensis]|uniref:hypothetical protein n=1 Tax=Rheinheimera oceanensis TaxID=2817449 RepID=UPI001BFDD53C|nr:hypothetical protein [Rheinheimera oceanensis]
MQNKVRPILIKKKASNVASGKSDEAVLDATSVKLAAARSKKAIMDEAVRSNQIFIIEED